MQSNAYMIKPEFCLSVALNLNHCGQKDKNYHWAIINQFWADNIKKNDFVIFSEKRRQHFIWMVCYTDSSYENYVKPYLLR